jgi:hypothetical protein
MNVTCTLPLSTSTLYSYLLGYSGMGLSTHLKFESRGSSHHQLACKRNPWQTIHWMYAHHCPHMRKVSRSVSRSIDESKQDMKHTTWAHRENRRVCWQACYRTPCIFLLLARCGLNCAYARNFYNPWHKMCAQMLTRLSYFFSRVSNPVYPFIYGRLIGQSVVDVIQSDNGTPDH